MGKGEAVDEQGWLRSADPQAMLTWLYRTRRVSERKARLLVCAAARSAWDELTDPRSARAVEVAERFAERRSAKAAYPDYFAIPSAPLLATTRDTTSRCCATSSATPGAPSFSPPAC